MYIHKELISSRQYYNLNICVSASHNLFHLILIFALEYWYILPMLQVRELRPQNILKTFFSKVTHIKE